MRKRESKRERERKRESTSKEEQSRGEQWQLLSGRDLNLLSNCSPNPVAFIILKLLSTFVLHFNFVAISKENSIFVFRRQCGGIVHILVVLYTRALYFQNSPSRFYNVVNVGD